MSNLEQKIQNKKEQIEKTEERLKKYKEQLKQFEEQKEQEKVQELLGLIKHSGLNIDEAKSLLSELASNESRETNNHVQ